MPVYFLKKTLYWVVVLDVVWHIRFLYSGILKRNNLVILRISSHSSVQMSHSSSS